MPPSPLVVENQFKYAYEHEHQLVQAFFGGRKGFYVDVGANDPVHDSQSFHLEELGWDGLMVEPEPECAARLRARRRGTVIECACSGPEHAGQRLPLKVAGPGAVHSTLEDSPVALGAAVSSTTWVRVDTLDNILARERVEPPVQLLSIDVEGHELAVLSGFTFSRWRPELVLLEDHVQDLSKHRTMLQQGYQIVRRTGFNSWYLPREANVQLSARARLEYVRKYFLGTPFRRFKYRRRPQN